LQRHAVAPPSHHAGVAATMRAEGTGRTRRRRAIGLALLAALVAAALGWQWSERSLPVSPPGAVPVPSPSAVPATTGTATAVGRAAETEAAPSSRSEIDTLPRVAGPRRGQLIGLIAAVPWTAVIGLRTEGFVGGERREHEVGATVAADGTFGI